MGNRRPTQRLEASLALSVARREGYTGSAGTRVDRNLIHRPRSNPISALPSFRRAAQRPDTRTETKGTSDERATPTRLPRRAAAKRGRPPDQADRRDGPEQRRRGAQADPRGD